MSIRHTVSSIVGVALIVTVLLITLTGCGGGVKEEVAILDTSAGEIVVGFYPEIAPNHVENFKTLARADVYDNTLFHRVIPGFVIQGGDPSTADPETPRERYGMGGTDREAPLVAEFSTEVKHQRGTLAMARSQDPNSGDAQFYIALNAIPHLDGQYTVFGEVLRGMEAVDSVAAMKTDMRDCPIEDARIFDVKIVPKSEAGLE